MPTGKRSIRQPDVVHRFAERLRTIRQSRDMTQRELADKAHVTFSYISRLEAAGAAPGIDLLDRLARALKVELVELLPPPGASGDADAHRIRVKAAFEGVVKKAGPETLSMLDIFLARLAETPAVGR